MTRVPLQLWAEVSEDGQRCSQSCSRWLALPPEGYGAYHRDEWCEEFGALHGERSPACIAAEQAAREADVTPEDVARITAMYERVCSENERLREQVDGLTTAHEKVYAEREKFRTKAMSFMRERDVRGSLVARLREREARVRAVVTDVSKRMLWCSTDVRDEVLRVLDDDGKDGE